MEAELQRYKELDARLVRAAKTVKVLTRLSWPASTFEHFVQSWRAGNPALPQVEVVPPVFGLECDELRAIARSCDQQHPVGRYIACTAQSYEKVARMLEAIGTPTFSDLSKEVYGSPKDPVARGLMSNLQVADHFVSTTDDFVGPCALHKEDYCILPETVAAELQAVVDRFFTEHEVKVAIDLGMASKAAAGAYKIRIRGGTCFAESDIPQLIHHEALVHTVTMLNGREQPNLKSLGLGSPRTTRTQEGLALFAELITNSIDLNRLRRVALRVHAIQMALDGANFIEVFKFFMNAGQNEQESFSSAMRIFRGGDVRGGVAFTKDIVYLPGLVFIHTFLRKAVQEGKLEYPHYIFSGRLTLGDVIDLEPYFQSGFITAPTYQPDWVKNRGSLMAFLVYSIFANRIKLRSLALEDFRNENAA